MTDEPANSQILAGFTETMANVRFVKEMQFNYVNYSLLLFAAVVVIDDYFGHRTGSDIAFAALVLIVMATFLHFLHRSCSDLVRYRRRIISVPAAFEAEARDALLVEQTDSDATWISGDQSHTAIKMSAVMISAMLCVLLVLL
ncbi:MAG: hypothetical protein CMM46_17095 [Rhodospirillaceae bacterium]|nr:hypothetical protein [Rhodospirillaceae bacterium]MBN36457.1 hypothetical protein [Rhodospirillaceae bacterium]|tara:strand:- start:22851 stop:23279 length:429 start_codon:yes stop_codon:yes gene_type:complete